MIGPWKRIEQLEEFLDRSHAALADALAENRRLTDIIVSMKREGFAPPAPAAAEDEPEDSIDSLHEQLQEAIGQMAEDDDEALELEVFARDQLAAGKQVGEVAHVILNGLDPTALLRE